MRKSQKVAGGLLFTGIMLAMQPAKAQLAAMVKDPAYRSTILNAVVNAVTTDHYSPKPIDDNYAAGIFKTFLQQLDPAHIIFLNEDLERLKLHQTIIDDQLKQGSAAFYDSVMVIYKARITAFGKMIPQLLSKPLDLSTKELLPTDTKDLPYPSGPAGQTTAWKKYLKLQVLEKMAAMQQASKDQQLQPALEAKAREVVKKTLLAWTSNVLTERALADKFYKYVDDVSKQMDAHSSYLQPGIYQTFAGADGNPYYGLGIALVADETEVRVKSVLPGTGAEASKKISAGTRIIAVEDSTGTMVPVAGMSAQDVNFMLSGKKGTHANFIVENNALDEVAVSIPREEMKYTSYKVRSALIKHNGKKIGLIYLPNFYGSFFSSVSAASDVAKELKNLKDLEAEAIIFDLRGNPGGSLTDGTSIGGYFFGEGPVSITKGKYFPQTHNASKSNFMFGGPLTVMVDESSASASEMLSAAVQDRSRGIVIGTASTFGKGTAQFPRGISSSDQPKGKPAPDYGSLTLTEKKFYRINGGTTQVGGVIPDIVMQERMSNTSIMEKDLNNVLPVETIQVKDYVPGKRNFNYELVVNQARARIKMNKAMQLIGSSMKKEKQLLAAPVDLNWKSFVTRSNALSKLRETISSNRLLAATQQLQIESGLPEWVNPGFIHPYEQLEIDAWMNGLKTDIYLLETILVTEDILSNPE